MQHKAKQSLQTHSARLSGDRLPKVRKVWLVEQDRAFPCRGSRRHRCPPFSQLRKTRQNRYIQVLQRKVSHSKSLCPTKKRARTSTKRLSLRRTSDPKIMVSLRPSLYSKAPLPNKTRKVLVGSTSLKTRVLLVSKMVRCRVLPLSLAFRLEQSLIAPLPITFVIDLKKGEHLKNTTQKRSRIMGRLPHYSMIIWVKSKSLK